MDAIMTKLRECRIWTKSKRLSVVAAYEDSSTDARVHDFCQRLTTHLGSDCLVAKQLWLFTELRMEQLRDIAADDAARAGLVIVSVHHAQALPDEVKTWLEAWLPRKRTHPVVLLAMFDPLYRGDSSSMKAYLEKAAAKAKVPFLAQSEDALDDR
jgi:enoyl-CoA hydratase/carnithine racemase